MKAAYITGHGGRDKLIFGAWEAPQAGAGEVLVKIEGSGLNRVDLYMRNSGAGLPQSLPMILGLDGAGQVASASPSSRFKMGDRVLAYTARTCGRCAFCQRGDEVLCTEISYFGEHENGMLAEVVSIPEENLFPVPAHLTQTEAACLPVSWLTAWRMLNSKAQVRPWETVLIFAIGGSVSLAAVQILTAMGIRTIASSRDEKKLQQAKALGASEVVVFHDKMDKDILKLTDGRGVDVVFENVGKAVWPVAMKSLVRGGRIVTCGATSGDDPSADLRRLFIRQLQILGSTLGTRAEFARMLEFVALHRLKPHIGSTYAFTDIHAAFDEMEAQRQFGKIAIDMTA